MFKQMDLKYDFNALEPYIDAVTMETHYTKHHAAYTKNFNDAVEKAGLSGKTEKEILIAINGTHDAETRTALENNGGGYYNHNLYFSTLSPDGGGKPAGDLAAQIDKEFGSFDSMKEILSAASVGQFGSGWGWLSANKEGDIRISGTANQSNPLIVTEGIWAPIFGIDVWEHAYYLKYKNLRADYVGAIYNIIDWKKVEENYNSR